LKNIYCDCHIHLSHSRLPNFPEDADYFCVSSCHNRSDLDILERLIEKNQESVSAHKVNIFSSFGLHPQIVSQEYLEKDFNQDFKLLEYLLQSKKIIAIGEFGFDFFTQEFKATKAEQKIVFESQLQLAQAFKVPVILHLRKSMESLFAYTNDLKKVPAVIFHSFPGTFKEALSILNRGVKAFFSFGKPLLNGKKSAIECVSKLPPCTLLLETDAPYQTLKGENETSGEDIIKVYKKAGELRNISVSQLSRQLRENFTQSILCHCP
jgi:TatD DNase family protein